MNRPRRPRWTPDQLREKALDGIQRVPLPERFQPGRRAADVVSIVLEALRRFLAHEMLDRAAALTYYVMLSMMPALLIAAGAFRALGSDDAINDVVGHLGDEGASTSLSQVIEDVLHAVLESQPESASAIGIAGLVTLLYASSSAFRAVGRALDVVARRPTGSRGMLRRLIDVGWTIVVLALVVSATLVALLTHDALEWVLGLVGLGGIANLGLARFVIGIAIMLATVAVIFWAAPSGDRRHFEVVTVGSLVTVGVWCVTTIGYSIYVSEIASYNVTYGTFAGLVILLLWIFMSNAALLFGAEVDAVLKDRDVPPLLPLHR
jgi:membrane protein